MAAGFQVVAPDRKLHGEEMVDLVCKSFGGYAERHAGAREWMLGPGFYSFAASRIGIMDGKVVTHFGVFEYQMRVGAARLRTGGIGSVVTHVDYRKRGYMEETAWACIKGMRAAGFDFSMLYGIQHFYGKFGYTRALSESEYTVTLGDLPGETGAEATRGKDKFTEFPFERRADLERLFNRYHARHTGAAVRPTYRTWNLRRRNLLGLSWKSKGGRVAGYVGLEDKGSRVDVLEAVGESEAILEAVAYAARKVCCDEIRFMCVAHESPLGRRLRERNMIERVVYFRNGMALGRLIHLSRTLGKMEGELAGRLVRAGLGGYRGNLAIGDGTDWATLEMARGKVRMVEGRGKTGNVVRGGAEVSQLILGTDDPDEVARAGKMRVTGDAGFLLRALFPRQWPMLAAGDHF